MRFEALFSHPRRACGVLALALLTAMLLGTATAGAASLARGRMVICTRSDLPGTLPDCTRWARTWRGTT